VQIGVLEATLEKDLKALMEVTDQEVAANPKKAQLLAVEGPLLAQIRQYMHDMPLCKAYASPFAPAAHLDNSSRSLVRPLIKGKDPYLIIHCMSLLWRAMCTTSGIAGIVTLVLRRWRGDTVEAAQAQDCDAGGD
jgi:hypothetical protein